ncbi:gluconokinase [Actinomadura rupiterrae]|uniref:gluconokinase n=1 Tax=Actinomadura rupiterrae TaxID=559627 RepID=UPI0020A2D4BA|nr:gluconokinase [Actinomadura rupiterrae]MCP2334943.1 gluconokinase [Actinomadura rupiterrae]
MIPGEPRDAWDRPLPAHPIVMVMGVAGSGKTTVGRLVAEELDWDFADADQFHPESNIAKMASGQELTDLDREPWLHKIRGWIDEHREFGTPGVVTCSALRRIYREELTEGRPEVLPVFLDGDRDLIMSRMSERIGHFFKPEMLDGQFRVLERPEPDEHILVLPTAWSVEDLVSDITSAVRP